MNWTNDKQLHYSKSFKWTRTGFYLGIWTDVILLIGGKFEWWLILPLLSGAIAILLLGAAKEIIYDGWMKKGCRELADMQANFTGVFDSLMFRKKRF